MTGGRRSQRSSVQQHNGSRQSRTSAMNFWKRLKKRNGFRLGAKRVYSIWSVTVGIGVFPANALGAYQFQCFMQKMASRSLRMKPSTIFQTYSANTVQTSGLSVKRK